MALLVIKPNEKSPQKSDWNHWLVTHMEIEILKKKKNVA